MRGRYARRSGKRTRSALLDEFCENTGHERKYAIKVLRGQRRKGSSGAPRGAASRYPAEDIRVLKEVWFAVGQPCGKRFEGEMLALWLASWERSRGALPPERFERLKGISSSQIDREMAPWRSAGRKRRIASAALTAMQREVAVRCEPWVEIAVGMFLTGFEAPP